MADKKENTKTLAQNKKARHEYFILETIEAGIELAGTEVKSARLGKVNLTDAYASIKNGEVFIKQMNISPFEQGNIFTCQFHPEKSSDVGLHILKNFVEL